MSLGFKPVGYPREVLPACSLWGEADGGGTGEVVARPMVATSSTGKAGLLLNADQRAVRGGLLPAPT